MCLAYPLGMACLPCYQIICDDAGFHVTRQCGYKDRLLPVLARRLSLSVRSMFFEACPVAVSLPARQTGRGRGGGRNRVFFTVLLLTLISALFSPAVTGCSGSSAVTGSELTIGQRNTVYYIDDHLGSAQILTDGESGVLYEGMSAPYGLNLDGSALEESADENNVDYSYTTKEIDRETGLVYFGKRYYSPNMGRWITPDPLYVEDPAASLSNPVSSNLYAYVRNNPVNFIDKTGYWDERVHYGSDEFGGSLKWAQDAGFGRVEAQIIANADRLTDVGKTGPYPWQDPSRHFNTNRGTISGTIGDSRMQHAQSELNAALKLEASGDHAAALFQLGVGLHSIQDLSAHRDEFVSSPFGIYNHVLKSLDDPLMPDNPLKNTIGFTQVQKDTAAYLQRFFDGAAPKE